MDFKAGSRGWCYLLEHHAGLEKGDFGQAESLINACRKTGLLPLDFCAEDKNRAAENLEDPDNDDPQEYAEALTESICDLAETYHPGSFWDFQQYYVEALVEKIDLLSLFQPLCAKYHIPIWNGRGWSDINGRAAMMRRFARHEEAGRRCVVLYGGDFDPVGLRIDDFLPDNLRELERAIGWSPKNLIIYRFCLNLDFIRRHRLSWIDNLQTSSGGDLADPSHKWHHYAWVQDYIGRYGKRKVEANALVVRPQAGRQLCQDAIERYVSREGIKRYEEWLKGQRLQVRAALPGAVRRALPGLNGQKKGPRIDFRCKQQKWTLAVGTGTPRLSGWGPGPDWSTEPTPGAATGPPRIGASGIPAATAARACWATWPPSRCRRCPARAGRAGVSGRGFSSRSRGRTPSLAGAGQLGELKMQRKDSVTMSDQQNGAEHTPEAQPATVTPCAQPDPMCAERDCCGAFRKGESPCPGPPKGCPKHCGARTRQPGNGSPFCPNPPANGSSRCYRHGGRSRRGIAHPRFSGAGRSKDLPADMRSDFERALSDEDLLSAKGEVAILDALLCKLLREVDAGDTRGRWQAVNAAFNTLKDAVRANDAARRDRALQELDRLIREGLTTKQRWADVQQCIRDKLAVQKAEWKREVDLALMIPAAQASALITAIGLATKAAVENPALFAQGPAAVLQEVSQRVRALLSGPRGAAGRELVDQPPS
jgi:hypothetical protein